jgi:hypothetical protein
VYIRKTHILGTTNIPISVFLQNASGRVKSVMDVSGMAMPVQSASLQRSNMPKTSNIEWKQQNKTSPYQISCPPLLLQVITLTVSVQYWMN